MIIEWFLGLAVGIVDWITSLFPRTSPPQWLVDLDTQWNVVVSHIGGMSAWVDWVYVLVVVGAVVVAWSVGLLVKLGRAAIAHIPQIGGSG